MTTAKELKAQVDAAETALLDLKRLWVEALKAEAPWKINDTIFDKNNEEAKVIRVEINYDQFVPVVVYRKKDSQWGSREFKLYSWDRL